MSEKSMFDDMSDAELKDFYAKIAIGAEKIKKAHRRTGCKSTKRHRRSYNPYTD